MDSDDEIAQLELKKFEIQQAIDREIFKKQLKEIKIKAEVKKAQRESNQRRVQIGEVDVTTIEDADIIKYEGTALPGLTIPDAITGIPNHFDGDVSSTPRPVSTSIDAGITLNNSRPTSSTMSPCSLKKQFSQSGICVNCERENSNQYFTQGNGTKLCWACYQHLQTYGYLPRQSLAGLIASSPNGSVPSRSGHQKQTQEIDDAEASNVSASLTRGLITESITTASAYTRDDNGFCQWILDQLRLHPYVIELFKYPVDEDENEAPGYYQVIKNPMDMSTIQKKLKRDRYSTADGFREDFQLMFKNCYKYNAEATAVYRDAQQLQELFNELWDQKHEWIASSCAPARTTKLVAATTFEAKRRRSARRMVGTGRATRTPSSQRDIRAMLLRTTVEGTENDEGEER